MQFDHSIAGRVGIVAGEVRLAEYIVESTVPQIESPRPVLELRTRTGIAASGHRPADHRWHQGLSLALPNVGAENFWGGPTYIRGEGYRQLPNNGSQVHESFVEESAGDIARIVERLSWVAEGGTRILSETRTLIACVLDADTWALAWQSELINVSGEALVFGSPTTRGRDDAGYGGIFWRGPDDFAGGDILSESGVVGDVVRGSTSEWLAFLAPDAVQGSVGVLMADAAPGAPHPWFARSAEFAGLCPAPFFHAETTVDRGDELVLGAVVAIGDRTVADRAPAVRAIARNLTLESGHHR